jgi:DNA-binding LytR/AlgR family response regulator
MKAIIIEDEKRAADRLERMILESRADIEIIERLESIRESVDYLNSGVALDVIFADIQLADGLSFEIFEQVKIDCPVIFTTAYDQYAIKAFKNNGIDYLLKPIDTTELGVALDKLKAMQQGPSMSDLMALASQLGGGKTDYRSRFTVKVGQKLRTIAVDNLTALYSENKGTYLLTQEGRNYLIDYSLEQVVEMLDPKRFFRISRKYIIAIEGVEEMLMWSNSRLKVTLKGSKVDDIVVARERTKEFKEWMEE